MRFFSPSTQLLLQVVLVIAFSVAQTKDFPNDDGKNKIEDILPHYAGDQHLDSFDQTLFLGGQKKARAFRELPDAERTEVFSQVFTAVDSNKDGHIDKDELSEWMFEALMTVDREDAMKSMEPIDANHDGKVSWFEYHDHVYGYLPGEDQEENQQEYAKYIKSSKRAYDLADRDGDFFLNAEEYHLFHNPRLFREMEKVVVMDSLEDFDTNGDGGIEISEFLGDFNTNGEDEDDLPEWIQEEKNMFETELDQDGNGKLEGSEIFDLESQEQSFRQQAEREVDHLLAMTDLDGDDVISLDEALQSEALFMGQDQHTHFHRNPNIVVKNTEL